MPPETRASSRRSRATRDAFDHVLFNVLLRSDTSPLVLALSNDNVDNIADLVGMTDDDVRSLRFPFPS